MHQSLNKGIFVLVLLLLVPYSNADAYTLGAWPKNKSEYKANRIGKARFRLDNETDKDASFDIIIMNFDDRSVVDAGLWKTDISKIKDQDSFDLKAGSDRIITVQFQEQGQILFLCQKSKFTSFYQNM